MASKSITLEITILSAENLQFQGKPIKKNSFVIVNADSLNSKSTKFDHAGGNSPSWQEKLELNMPIKTQALNLQVQSKVGSKNRVVGDASVPVSDLVGDNCNSHVCGLKFLSYRLRDTKGERNGIINVSVKVSAAANRLFCSTEMIQNSPEFFGFSQPPVMGFPVGSLDRSSCRTVTGIPVSCIV